MRQGRAGKGEPKKKSVKNVATGVDNAPDLNSFCAEDKNPKETWAIPTRQYAAVCVWIALIAGWTLIEDLNAQQAEYALAEEAYAAAIAKELKARHVNTYQPRKQRLLTW